MDNIMENTVDQLKALIDKYGPAYLSEEPYLTYKKLIDVKTTDAKTAGAIMLALVRGMDSSTRDHDNLATMSKHIQQECCFNKKMADQVAEIFLSLYSRENNDQTAISRHK